MIRNPTFTRLYVTVTKEAANRDNLQFWRVTLILLVRFTRSVGKHGGAGACEKQKYLRNALPKEQGQHPQTKLMFTVGLANCGRKQHRAIMEA